MSTFENYFIHLPFANLTDHEFRAVTGFWNNELVNPQIDFFDLIPNPDKFDERDSDNMLDTPTSKYYSSNELNKLLTKITNYNKTISMYHRNIRSLPKNLELLEDFIYCLQSKPDIIAISETKMNDRTIVESKHLLFKLNMRITQYLKHCISLLVHSSYHIIMHGFSK